MLKAGSEDGSTASSRLGHALYCSGRYAEAAEAYETGLKHDPNVRADELQCSAQH